VFEQMNFKAAGLGIVLTFVAVLVEVIFIPIISTQLVTLKASAPDSSSNSTIDAMNKIIFLTPIGTIIGGFIASFAGGMLMK
jgi:hypothetical protein